MKICRSSAIKRLREAMQMLLNQGGTAGIPVPMGLELRRFLYPGKDRKQYNVAGDRARRARIYGLPGKKNKEEKRRK